MSDKYFTLLNNDFDGVCSLLLQSWLNPSSTFFYKAVSNQDAEKEIETILHNSINPRNIHILNFPLRESFLQFDKQGIKFIDSHKCSEEFVDSFHYADVEYEDFTSTCKMIYKKNEDIAARLLTKHQKMMVLYSDDYSSEYKRHQESIDLGIMFYINRHDTKQFLEDYKEGYKPIIGQEKKYLNRVKYDVLQKTSNYPVFRGYISFNGRMIETVATFGDSINPIILDIFFRKNPAEFLMFANLKTNKVRFVQKYSENLFNVGEFAERYCDGSGNIMSGYGSMNEVLLEMFKNLKPVQQ